MRQRRWLEFVNDYDCDIHYHPGKANKVADALSRRRMASLVTLPRIPGPLRNDLSKLEMEFVMGQLSTLSLQPTIMEEIRGEQLCDPLIEQLKYEVRKDKRPNFQISEDGVLGFKGRLCVPNDEGIKRKILYEAHTTPYSMHPGTTKMYQDLKNHFWWPGMKKDIVEYVARCLTCQQVQDEH